MPENHGARISEGERHHGPRLSSARFQYARITRRRIAGFGRHVPTTEARLLIAKEHGGQLGTEAALDIEWLRQPNEPRDENHAWQSYVTSAILMAPAKERDHAARKTRDSRSWKPRDTMLGYYRTGLVILPMELPAYRDATEHDGNSYNTGE